MEKQILVISNHLELVNKCKDILEPLGFSLSLSSSANLLINIYAKKPVGLLFYIDRLSNDAIETINSVLSVMYLPSLSIFTNPNFKRTVGISNTTFIHEDNLLVTLPPLLNQMTTFENTYHRLSNNYDSFVLLNDETQKIMSPYIKSRPNSEDNILRDFYRTLFTENPFVENEPDMVVILEKSSNHPDQITVTQFHNSMDDTLLPPMLLYENLDALLIKTQDTGFYYNLDSDQLSDIDGIEALIPEKVLAIRRPSRNIAVTSVNEMMIIYYDFNDPINQYALSLLKAFNTTLDFMKSIKGRINDVHASFVYTMNALARAAESKDDITGHHIKRVNEFCKTLALTMDLDPDFVEEIEIAAQMHDVGKIKIPEHILNKPGKLTDEEFNIIKSHTLYGEDIIGGSNYLIMAKTIARSHHEKYDGSGYPDGLKGDEIPLAARVVALADIYDALRSPRPYKEGFTHEKAYDIIVHGDGRVEPTHFDPKVLHAFIEIHEKFNTLYEQNKEMDF